MLVLGDTHMPFTGNFLNPESLKEYQEITVMMLKNVCYRQDMLFIDICNKESDFIQKIKKYS